MSKNCHYKTCGVLVAAVAFLIFACVPVFGQEPSPSPSPSSSATPIPTPTPEKDEAQPAPVNYFFPDLAPDATTFHNKIFDIRFGFAIVADYTFIGQDSLSRAQVGPQASKGDLRGGRVIITGQFNFKRPWTFLIGGDFNEFRGQGDRVFDGLDFALTIPLWKKARITFGKQKEPFIYEMATVSGTLAQQERILTPFFTGRNIGIRYQDNYLNDRISFGVGVFNDWFKSGVSFKTSGTQVSSRLTGLPIESKDGRKYLHLGVGLRYNGADNGQMRYRGRLESNVTDSYVDTGNFPAKYAKQLSLEALYNTGPGSVLVEYTQSWVNSPTMGNPSFNGFYVLGSYVLTGENRPYDKSVGHARRIIPKSRWGAVELVARFTHLDLDDTLVKGGQFAMWYAGVNWWASRQWKLGVGYGFNDLDRFNTTGRTQVLTTRLQWAY